MTRGKDNAARVKIPAHFGDIMSVRETSLTLPPGFTGLERIILTANGNLQRILSAFYNEPVTIEILRNTPLGEEQLAEAEKRRGLESGGVLRAFDREVNLVCNGKVVTNAVSLVVIRDQKVLDMVEKEGVGIGQIFRYLDKLPNFELLGIGRTKGGPWWRDYSLKMSGVECYIRETFPSRMFEPGWLRLVDGVEGVGSEPLEEETTMEWVFGKKPVEVE